MFKNGDVVFFKSGKQSSARKSPEVQFKGHAFGILLGHVPPFQKDPPPEHLLRLMGTVGFLTFDDLGEFFGPEIAAQAVAKYEDKYYGKVVPPADPNAPATAAENQQELPLDAEPARPSGLVGLHGQPLQSEEDGDEQSQ